MKNRIELYNRYYKNVYLEQISDDEYQLYGPDESFSYMRVGFNNKDGKTDYEDINFIDPDGGPFLKVGNKIDDKIITHIVGMIIEKKEVYIIGLKKEDQK